MTKELPQELVREFVLASHNNLNKIKEMHTAEPDLIDTRYLEFDESPLEAASHMGNRPIVEYILGHGVPTTICTSAMLGNRAEVEQFLEADPALVYAKGAHGFTLMFHTALSGNTEIADLLLAYGGGAGKGQALHAAILRNRIKMVHWLLAHDADTMAKNFQGKTPLEAAQMMERHEIVGILQKID